LQNKYLKKNNFQEILKDKICIKLTSETIFKSILFFFFCTNLKTKTKIESMRKVIEKNVLNIKNQRMLAFRQLFSSLGHK
jgi:hypothetical protein